MKKKKVFQFIMASFIIFLLQTTIYAQKSSAPWSEWKEHGCYKGLLVSVKNMGYNKDNKKYYWGVRIINNYPKAVAFRYLLSVGGEKENVTKYFYFQSDKLEPENIWDKEKDVFSAVMFESSSNAWKVKIREVCFDGMQCGGPNECYADCDVVEKRINQPCGLEGNEAIQTNSDQRNLLEALSGTASADDENLNNNYSGEYTEWTQEGKDVVFTIGKTEAAIFWKKKEGESPAVFKALIPGIYRYDLGQDFMMIKFESENRLSLWNNGSLVGYFKRPGSEKKEVTEIATKDKPEETRIIIKNGFWSSGGSNKVKITMVDKEIMVQDLKSKNQDPIHYNASGFNEYHQRGTSENYYFTVISPTRIARKYNGIEYPDYEFISDTEEKTGASTMNLNGKWKSSVKYIKSSSITVLNEDEFIWEWKVNVLGMGNKGQTHFKRESGNVFTAEKTKSQEWWCRMVITCVSDDRLDVQTFDCAGKLAKSDQLIRVKD